MNTVNVLGINYAVTDYQAASDLIHAKISQQISFSVLALPVHGLIERRNDPEFDRAIQSADLIVPDGQPVRWAMNFFHNAELQDRVYGPKLLERVLSERSHESLRVFIYGGSTIDVLEKFKSYIKAHYPHVVISGAYREDRVDVQTLDAQSVNDTNPDLVIVGLGCPIQEKWIAKHGPDIDAATIGVGAALSFFSGDKKMAPNWMQDAGLEWLFRLTTEPKRLWRRYLYTNSYFVGLMIIELGRHLARRVRGSG